MVDIDDPKTEDRRRTVITAPPCCQQIPNRRLSGWAALARQFLDRRHELRIAVRRNRDENRWRTTKSSSFVTITALVLTALRVCSICLFFAYRSRLTHVPVRACTVSFRDVRGICVEVEAESLYEAVVLAIRRLREDSRTRGRRK